MVIGNKERQINKLINKKLPKKNAKFWSNKSRINSNVILQSTGIEFISEHIRP